MAHSGEDAPLGFAAKALIPCALFGGVPTDPRVQLVTAQFGPEFAVDGDASRIGGAVVNAILLQVRSKEGVTLVEHEGRIGVVLRVIEGALHPEFLRRAAASGGLAIKGETVVVVVGIKLPGEGKLFFVADAFDESGLFLGGAEDRQKHRGENGNDGDDDEQFDEGKCASADAPRKPRRSGQGR